MCVFTQWMPVGQSGPSGEMETNVGSGVMPTHVRAYCVRLSSGAEQLRGAGSMEKQGIVVPVWK